MTDRIPLDELKPDPALEAELGSFAEHRKPAPPPPRKRDHLP